MVSKELKFTAPEIHSKNEEPPQREVLRMSTVNADFHVIHFGFDERVGGGDQDASLDIQRIVEYAVRFIPETKTIVVGTHPFDYARTEADQNIYSDQLTLDQKHTLFLQKQKEAISEAKARAFKKYGREGPHILFGVEADVSIDAAGVVSLVPPAEILAQTELDMITVALHGERIKNPHPEKLAEALEHALTVKDNGKHLINRIAHPFRELRKIYDWDQERFKELMDLAKRNLVAIEINASKDFDVEILNFLVQNENFLDFGSDHHAFRYYLKESLLPSEIELSREEQELLDLLTRRNKFQRRERILWAGSSSHPGLSQLLPNIPTEERKSIRDRIWQLYKHRGMLERLSDELEELKTPLDEKERRLEQAFVQERETIIDNLLPDTDEDTKDQRSWLRRELTFLYNIFPVELERARKYDPERLKWYEASFTKLEDKIAQTQISFSDTKALIQRLHEAKPRLVSPHTFSSRLGLVKSKMPS